MWSEVVHLVCWLWCWRCSPQSAAAYALLGLPGMSYRVICRWLLLVLSLEVPRRGKTVNQGWLLLVSGLRPLTKARCCLSEGF